MASIRDHRRADGTLAYRVYFRHEGRQTCYTFDSPKLAETFRTAVDQLGAASAIALHRVERAPRHAHSVTVTEWVKEHIDHLSGAQSDTVTRYRRYLENDIAPVLGHIPLDQLTDRDIARWIQGMKTSPKTIANKQRFLSGALAGAVGKHLTTNPAAGAAIPRGQKREMVCLSRQQFDTLLEAVTEPWRPLVEFLVMTGCRWGEATALRPGDINKTQHTVRITQAWKKGGEGEPPWKLGPPKTRMSLRTINVPATLLARLNYTGDWLFTNTGQGHAAVGGPVRPNTFHAKVWRPACTRAGLEPRPRIHDLRHTHASWLIQDGQPLPVIQRRLGHESIQTTVDVYGHLDRRSDQAASDAIGRLLS